MASEYLKWKYRDVKPDGPPRERTKKEKLANWFHYNKGWIVVWAVLLVCLGSMVWSALGGKVRPDHIFAYVGERALPQDCIAALERELAALGQDVNGDGKTVVEVRQYPSGGDGADPGEAMQYAYAYSAKLMADLNEGESYFFLLEDPEGFQKGYQILAGPDGQLSPEGDDSAEGKAALWAGCPVLAGLDLGGYQADALSDGTIIGDCQELLSGLYLARRGFYYEKQAAKHEADGELWAILTKGAIFS